MDNLIIITTFIIELIYLIAIFHSIFGDSDARRFWRGYIFVLTITNILTAIVYLILFFGYK